MASTRAPLTAALAIAAPEPQKPIESMVLDTGPLIKNDPPVSTLLARAGALFTTPAVLAEIKDAETRSRVDTTLVPFLSLRNPKPESIKFVTEYARKTGDLEVMSKADVQLIALAYELQVEKDGGKNLRNDPLAKPPSPLSPRSPRRISGTAKKTESGNEERPGAGVRGRGAETSETGENGAAPSPVTPTESVGEKLENITVSAEDEGDSDDEGWITPDNFKKHLEADTGVRPVESVETPLFVALLTSDYAMQNVTLRIGLGLLSPSLSRITELKSWVLRCHGCFSITRVMTKQFCPRCGQPTLIRASCSTDENGKFQVHLKKNFQWNNRGNVYSIPKPTHGTASGKHRGQGGGKNGWGNELILAEDQKEYVRKQDEQQRRKGRDIMDEDYLPGIVSGDRTGWGGKDRIRVGAGRGVNGKRRR